MTPNGYHCQQVIITWQRSRSEPNGDTIHVTGLFFQTRGNRRSRGRIYDGEAVDPHDALVTKSPLQLGPLQIRCHQAVSYH